jgi:hypothetical protein
MKIITNRRIIDNTSNFYGQSNFDNYSEACGCSNFDDVFDVDEISSFTAESESCSNLEGHSNADNLKRNIFSKKEKSSSPDKTKTSFSDRIKNIKENWAKRKDARKDLRKGIKDCKEKLKSGELTKEQYKKCIKAKRLAKRSARIEARNEIKAKKNAKKLTVVKKDGKEKFLFSITKLFKGKKKYKDGKEKNVSAKNQVNVTAPNGENIVVDKTEVAQAMGVNPATVTPAQIQSALVINPPAVVQAQGISQEVAQPSGQPVFAVTVPESNVVGANDGEIYLAQNTQPSDKEDIDVADEETGMSKTTKIILFSTIGIAVIIIGIVAYKSMNKN